MKDLYPFARLSGPANVLVMPSLHAANISARLLTQLGGEGPEGEARPHGPQTIASWAASAAWLTRSETVAPSSTICAGLSRPMRSGPTLVPPPS